MSDSLNSYFYPCKSYKLTRGGISKAIQVERLVICSSRIILYCQGSPRDPVNNTPFLYSKIEPGDKQIKQLVDRKTSIIFIADKGQIERLHSLHFHLDVGTARWREGLSWQSRHRYPGCWISLVLSKWRGREKTVLQLKVFARLGLPNQETRSSQWRLLCRHISHSPPWRAESGGTKCQMCLGKISPHGNKANFFIID